jgi:hypothetical protein
MILNVALNLKGQHVKGLCDTYTQKKEELVKALKVHNAGGAPPAYELAADLTALSPLLTPVDKLQEIIFDKLTNRRRAVMFATALAQAVHSLNDAIDDRNRLIDEYRTTGPHSQSKLFQFYFSIPDRAGTVDDRFGSAIRAINSYLDDCIFFAKSIADDLSAHGKKLESAFQKRYGEKAPSVGVLAIENEQFRRLLPDAKDYASWGSAESP